MAAHHPVPEARRTSARLTLVGGGRTLARQSPAPITVGAPCPIPCPDGPSDRSHRHHDPSSTSIRAGLLDAGLAATLWRLLEGRVPLVVVGADDGADPGDAAGGAPRHAPARAATGRVARRGRDVRLAAAGHRARLVRPAPIRSTGRSSGPTTRSSSRPSCPTACRPSPGASRPGSPYGRRRSATAWPRRCPATPSRTSWRRSVGRR